MHWGSGLRLMLLLLNGHRVEVRRWCREQLSCDCWSLVWSGRIEFARLSKRKFFRDRSRFIDRARSHSTVTCEP